MKQLYWLDLETTGLDPGSARILEVAVSVAEFERPFEAREVYHAVLNHHGAGLSAFIRDMHTKNGLLAECYGSTLYQDDVERALLEIVPDIADREERPVLAGSTIHFDKAFLHAGMPELNARFSHRLYDASAIKLFCQSLGMPKQPKAEAHRAREDVRESIAHAKACAEWLGRLPR